MKINKYFTVFLFICFVLEIMIGQISFTLNYELDLILVSIFSFYIINREFFLEEESYQKEKYILNVNNFIILIFLYLESIFSSSLVVVNIIFVFIIMPLVINKNFPEKINVKLISILIVYFTIFFIIKDYILLSFFLNYDFYITIYSLYAIAINVLLNILLVLIFCFLFKKKFVIKKKD